ncbi:MAG: hypothetical protein ABIJ00_14530 [Candidatus Eisenbacteria bacterium]
MEMDRTSPLVGVVLGQAASPSKAAEIADTYGRCPYCASFTTLGPSAMGMFAIPPERRWWLDNIAETAGSTLGFENAEALVTEAIDASSPWSRGDVKPNLHPAPCGTDCRQCHCYGHECQGCPATLDYLGS